MKMITAALLLVTSLSFAQTSLAEGSGEPKEIAFAGETPASIAAGVSVPAGRAFFLSGAIRSSPLKKDGATVYDRFGDTYLQAVSCLKNLEEILVKQGLNLKDVIYLRASLVPDTTRGSRPDFPGWFTAYGEYFNTKKNPAKTVRSTVGVAALVSPDWLIELEAVAVYPRKE